MKVLPVYAGVQIPAQEQVGGLLRRSGSFRDVAKVAHPSQ